MSVPIERWGRDHESTLLYMESVCVDHRGVPDIRRMRCDPRRHPGLAHEVSRLLGPCPPTRLKDGELLNHDDWDCVDDMVTAGVLVLRGTGMQPEVELTTAGWGLAHTLRRKRAGAA